MCAVRAVTLMMLGASVSAWKTYQGYRLVETEIMGEDVAQKLMNAGETWDFWRSPGRDRGAVIFLAPEQWATTETALKDLAISYKTLTQDMGEHPIKQNETTFERGSDNILTRFYTLSQIYAYLDEMAEKYPQLLTVHETGRTFENRAIKYVKISNGNKIGEKAIFIDAGIHARERISPSVALYAIYQLVENYEENKELLDGVHWYILPVLNPDGYEYTFTHDRLWRKSRSNTGSDTCLGVDINRNFPDHWNVVGASSNKCSNIYSGPSAASELETQALLKVVMNHRSEILLYLTLHNYGPFILQPFGYTTEPSEDHDELFALSQKAADAIESVRGTRYTVGTSSQLIYKTSGSSDDWAKNVAGIKFSYTMELPRGGFFGFDTSTSDILPIVTETFEALRVFAKHVSKMSPTGTL